MALGKLLVIIGFSVVSLGLVVSLVQRIPWIYNWFGHLPGDIRVEGAHIKFYAPLASMVLVSVLVNLLWRLVAYISSRFTGYE